MSDITKEYEFLPYTDNELKTLARASRILEKRMRYSDCFSSPSKVRQFVSFKLGHLEHEVFAVMFLDNRHRLIQYEELFTGTIDGAAVYPREVMKRTFHYNANSLILLHCHPSGVAEPSDADIAITRKLTEAMSHIDVRVLDHLIAGGSQITSLAERGLI